MDTERLAFCGIGCNDCPIHWILDEETEEGRERLRRVVADTYNSLFGSKMRPEELEGCSGCRCEDGPRFYWCDSCPIRTCAMEMAVESCAECRRYPCDDLGKVTSMDPAARSRLEVIRRCREAGV